jgi:hypothetical protein
MMEKEKITKFINIGVLDIRDAAGKDLGKVNMVNVGHVLHTPETFELVKGGKRVNVGQFIDANKAARVLLSPTTFNTEFFNQQDGLLELLAFGPVMVDWNTSSEAIQKGLNRLDVFGGPLICPRHLLGILQSKIHHQNGEIIVYERVDARIVMGKLVLDENYLNSLEDSSELIVVGALKIQDVLDNGTLQQKIKRLYVQGRITCHEENAGLLDSIVAANRHKMKIIPAGYTLVEKPLTINTLALDSFKNPKLYCTEWVRIDSDVSPEMLNKNLDALISEEQVYCPIRLKDIIMKKCDWLKTNVELYAGELWVIEDVRHLPVYAFDHLTDVATIVVLGEMKIDPEIKPETLIEKLDKVHNLGSILCTPEQMGAIQSLLGSNEGRLVDTTQPKPEKHSESIENAIVESYVNSNYVSI